MYTRYTVYYRYLTIGILNLTYRYWYTLPHYYRYWYICSIGILRYQGWTYLYHNCYHCKILTEDRSPHPSLISLCIVHPTLQELQTARARLQTATTAIARPPQHVHDVFGLFFLFNFRANIYLFQSFTRKLITFKSESLLPMDPLQFNLTCCFYYSTNCSNNILRWLTCGSVTAVLSSRNIDKLNKQ